ncbi:enoyl-CoA delta isomerase 1, mitochondrial-like isoform X1 [Watersipora subatra]|uniref:enoyl-CoA delta isomerase 1, mitochondrial-like isoform X1 n=1 Tax=Watersipora subatra TaxID=2589382 RepID=UPI00355C217C
MESTRKMAALFVKSAICSMRQNARNFSSTSRLMNSGGLLDMDVDSSTGVATMHMRKPPVNSLNLEFLTDIGIALDKLHAEGCRGLVLGSSLPKIFSAGLEITEMYQPDEARLREFWRSLQDVWLKLYGSPMVTMAAITGHAPAGGCLLAMCCDWRVMAEGKFTIGLNETLLGIVAPPWFSETMLNTIGQRETEKALQLGKLYNPSEALTVGLVDHLAPLDDLPIAVNKAMASWLNIPDHARHLTKLQLRQKTIDRLLSRRQEDIDYFVKFTTKDSIQKSLEMYLKALKNKSK